MVSNFSGGGTRVHVRSLTFTQCDSRMQARASRHVSVGESMEQHRVENEILAEAEFDHLGVVVNDLDEARKFVERVFRAELDGTVERADVRAQFFVIGSLRLELVEVTDESARERRLGADPARIEHLAFAVSDLEAAAAELRALGTEVTELQQTGTSRRFWTNPTTSDGVLYQFVERP